MLDTLRRLETGISDVSHQIRNMPAQAPAVAAALPAAAEVPETEGYVLRLMVANLAALAMVAPWWFRRRKPATPAETGPASSLEDAPPGAALRTKTPAVMSPQVTASTTTPEAETPSEVATAEAEASLGFTTIAMP